MATSRAETGATKAKGPRPFSLNRCSLSTWSVSGLGISLPCGLDGALMPAQINTLRRREKLFGEGRCLPLDRNAKARIMVLARALTHRTEKGKHYGVLTAKFVRVLEALLWGFHNAATGRCFPIYERIAERATARARRSTRRSTRWSVPASSHG